MAVQFKIRITKEIIDHCKDCGSEMDAHEIPKKCAVAYALKDIFPDVYVTNDCIFPFGSDFENIQIPLPVIAQQFIKLFDGFSFSHRLRLLLPEFEFAIDIPDEVIEQINIDEVRELFAEGKETADLHRMFTAV